MKAIPSRENLSLWKQWIIGTTYLLDDTYSHLSGTQKAWRVVRHEVQGHSQQMSWQIV